MMEAKLQRLVVKGLLTPKEVAGWRAPASEAVPHSTPGEAMSFTDFHKHGFVVLASDFLHGFVIMCEAFLGIAPNKDLFQRVFEVKTRKVHGLDDDALAPMGRMNL